MAMPTPPPKPPSRGNSQQMTKSGEGGSGETRVTIPPQPRSREVHPAVTEFQNRYAQMWDDNEELRASNTRLINENEMLRRLDAEKTALVSSLRQTLEDSQRSTEERLSKQEHHFRERLAEAERAKERYLRYAVSISTDLKSCIASLEAADNTAMEMAHTPSDKQLNEIDTAIAEATHHAVDQRAASLGVPISKSGEA